MNKILKRKHIVSLILVLCCLTCFLRFGVTAFTDENDLISGSGAAIGGAPGNGSYMNVYCMWKITVYVGKSDTLAISSETSGFDSILGSQSLTEDYYKFGNTFYLYKDSTRGAGLAAQNYSLDKIFLTVRDKEWYRHNLEGYINGTVSASEYFKQGTMRELSGIVFDGSQRQLTGSLAVPEIPLFGGNTEAAVSFFSSGRVSDVLIGLAAESAGGSVNDILASKSFTINGKTAPGSKWGTNMLTAIRGTDGIHTSCVPWVIEYEPVITIQLKNSGHAMALTATEIGVAMICGRYNFTSNQSNVDAIFRPSEAALKAKVSSTFLTMGLAALFQNLPASAYVSKGWFGYPNLDSMPRIESHGATAAHYVTDQIKAGGVGLRYQVSEAELVRIEKSVSSRGPGSDVSDLSGFEFTVTAASGTGNTPGETYKVVTDAEGVAELRLRKGTYKIVEENGGTGFVNGAITSPGGRIVQGAGGAYYLTVGDGQNLVKVNNNYSTGKLEIRKLTDINDFTGLYFVITGLDDSNRRINITLDGSGSKVTGTVVTAYRQGSPEIFLIGYGSVIPAGFEVSVSSAAEGGRYQRTITLSGLPEGNYLIKEVIGGDRDRFLETCVNGDYAAAQTEATVTVQAGSEPCGVTFYNMSRIGTLLEIVKYASDGDFTDTYFGLSGSVDGKQVQAYIDSSGNICPDRFDIEGNDGPRTVQSANADLISGRILVAAVDAVQNGETVRKITVEGLPEGQWSVSELIGYPERYNSVHTEYNGVRSEGGAREVTLERDKTAALAVFNVKTVKLTVNFLDKYDYRQGIRTPIRESIVCELVCGRNYDKRDVVTANNNIHADREYYYEFEGIAVGELSGDPLSGTAGDADLEADVIYGFFHRITVNYRDKYTNEIMFSETVMTEAEGSEDV